MKCLERVQKDDPSRRARYDRGGSNVGRALDATHGTARSHRPDGVSALNDVLLAQDRKNVRPAPIIPSLIGGPKLFINLGPKPPKRALERERPQIVNNFARGASVTTNNRPIR
jgi:hypothetical protein